MAVATLSSAASRRFGEKFDSAREGCRGGRKEGLRHLCRQRTLDERDVGEAEKKAFGACVARGLWMEAVTLILEAVWRVEKQSET